MDKVDGEGEKRRKEEEEGAKYVPVFFEWVEEANMYDADTRDIHDRW